MTNNKPQRIKRNAVKCKNCHDVIISAHRHHFVSCKCGACSVDGGKEYLRRIGNLDMMIELAEYHDDA